MTARDFSGSLCNQSSCSEHTLNKAAFFHHLNTISVSKHSLCRGGHFQTPMAESASAFNLTFLHEGHTLMQFGISSTSRTLSGLNLQNVENDNFELDDKRNLECAAFIEHVKKERPAVLASGSWIEILERKATTASLRIWVVQ